MIRIKKLSDWHSIIGVPPPKHPLVSVVDFGAIEFNIDLIAVELLNPFYVIILYKGIEGVEPGFLYGRKKVNVQDKTLFLFQPDQIVEVYDILKQEDVDAWGVIFHPDLLLTLSGYDMILQHDFLAHNLYSALKVSQKEENIIQGILDNIREEYNQMDDYSTTILGSHIMLLFTYMQRFYHREFENQKSSKKTIVVKFEKLLDRHLSPKMLQKNGLPTVDQLANKMNFSRNYLGNVLKRETGKSTQEHVHYHVVRRSKVLLLKEQYTIAEIAFQLGFEYPQYFSRFFKKEVGKTPSEYRKLML